MDTTENKTPNPETFTIIPGKDDSGIPIFSVLVKRTYDILNGQPAVRAEQPNPLVKVDIYYDNGDPEWATVQYESDLFPYKIGTDVVLIGKAYAPDGIPVPQLNVCLEVAEFKKIIRITGDRKCLYRDNRDPAFTDPIEFSEMEIRYERSYGGKDLLSISDMPFYYPRNHLGKGLALKNVREVVDELQLPNLEDPEDMLTPERVILGEPERWNQQPLPQGYGWYQPTWYPRCSFIGSVPGFVQPDEVMREELLGLVPRGQIALARQFKLPSFNSRFNSGASLGLILPYLIGDERIRLFNLTPEKYLEFFLPQDIPKIILDIGLGQNQLQAFLHTVCIRPEDMQVDMVWRGAHEYPGVDWLPEMKKMDTWIN